MHRLLLPIFLLVLLLSGCGPANVKEHAQGNGQYETIYYSKLFGILRDGASRQVFYIHGQDTMWGQKFDTSAAAPRLVVLSTVFAGFLELLNQQQCIVGIDNEKFYSDSILLQLLAKEQIIVTGEEGQVQIEKLLSAKPDFLVCGSFESGNMALGERLSKLGVQLLYCDNFKEPHPLARAEWIKFFGAVTGQYAKADSIFRKVESNYQAIVSRNFRSSRLMAPVVMADAMFGESWFVPGGNSFTAQLIADAGGNYIFKDKKPLFTYPLTLEDVLNRGREADIWIHTNTYHTFAALAGADRRYTYFKPYKNGRIYNNSKGENQYGGNDYWERGVGRPDLILSDLYAIINDTLPAEENLHYYEKLK